MQRTYKYYLAIAVAILVIWAAFYFFTDVVTYLLIAWVLSLLGQPVMRFLGRVLRFGKHEASRSVCAALTLVIFILVISGLMAAFVPLLVTQIESLSKVDINAVQKSLESPIARFNVWAHDYGFLSDQQDLLQELTLVLKGWFDPTMIGNVFRKTFNTLSDIMIGVGSVAFITFFFLKDDNMFLNLLLAFIPNKYEGQMRHAVAEISRMLARYFAGLLLQATIFSTIISITLSILGNPNALLIGILGGLFNIIPYVGPILGAGMGVVITLTSNLGVDFYSELLPMLLKVIVTFSATQMLDNFIITSYVHSNSVQAHPLEIFLVVIMGAKVGGVLGMVLAIPAYTVLRVMAKIFLSEFKIVQKLTRDLDEPPPPSTLIINER